MLEVIGLTLNNTHLMIIAIVHCCVSYVVNLSVALFSKPSGSNVAKC